MTFSQFDKTTVLLEIKRIEELLSTVERILSTAPDTILRVRNGKSGPRFYIRRAGNIKDQYCRKQDPELPSLIRKYCAAHLEPVLTASLHALRKNPAEYDAENIERKLEELEQKLGALMPSEFCSRRSFIENWENAPYAKSSLTVSGQKTYRTEKGDIVRSKLECIVANILHHLHIPYRYEAQLVLINGRTVFPDFTILSPVNGRIYYLEVCGMMDSTAYVDGLLQRVRELSDSGISIGDNLLLCFESANCPFDTQGFVSMLQRSVLARSSGQQIAKAALVR